MPSKFSWSADSALWQIEHGEYGTPRTNSAFTYLWNIAKSDRERHLVAEIYALRQVLLEKENNHAQ